MKRIKYTLGSLLLVAGMSACTNLHEKVIDEVLGSSNASPENALAAAYGTMDDGTFVDHSQVFAMQEYTTDEAMLPTRGSDWGDGGVWRTMHEFTWAPDNSIVTTTWNSLNAGITKSLTAINTVNNAKGFAQKDLFMAESRAMLAFYTYHTLDLFGQAPYRDPLATGAPLQVRQAKTAIDSLITEVEGLIPNLADLGTQNTHNGRFTKQAAYALLADMYMNRAVFKDRYAATFNFKEAAVDGKGTDMDKVIDYTSRLISDSRFSLESNYFKNFDIDNSGRPELIFVVDQQINNLRSSSNSIAYMPVERSQKPSPVNRGTNATCTTPEFYATWNNNHEDPRFSRKYQYASDGSWFMNDGSDTSMPATSTFNFGGTQLWFHFNRGMQVGQQYGPTLTPDGKFVMTGAGRIKVSKLYCEKNTSLPVDFTPDLNFDNPAQSVFTQAQINRGVRVFKFEFDPENGNGNSNVDIPLFRLGGMYCLRAEAYFRNGSNALAMADINKLRTTRTRETLYASAPGKAITTLDEQTLYNELGYEMYWEMYRRKEAIRFGKFDLALPASAKPVSQPFRRIFPIPQSTMDASKAFGQNDKY